MKLEEGMKGWFTPGAGSTSQERVRAEIVKVWSDTCVNLRCEDGTMPSSVLVKQPGCTGYFFEPDVSEATQLEPHQQRVVNEHDDLSTKVVKLTSFLESEHIAKVAHDEVVRLKVQLAHMKSYLGVLSERIANFVRG